MSVLKLAPNFAQKSEVLYKLAVIFGKTYQLDQAINYFKLATLESSGAPAVNRRIDILIKMGICYIEKKEYADALRSFEAALAMNDQNCRTLQHMAWCEFLMAKYTPALEHIQKAITLKESDGDGYYIKGRILLATEKYPEAKEAFNRAIFHNQAKAIYLASLGVVNCLTKLYSEAFENFLKATQMENSLPEVWFDIGILYELHQQITEAIVAYQKAVEVAPEFTDAAMRKQSLSNESASKPPLPNFIHPEFRVFDTMVPMKSFINNQKVKKASEPCLTSTLPTQPTNLITSIFNNIGMAPPTSVSAPARTSLPQPIGGDTALLPPPLPRPEDAKLQGSHVDGVNANAMPVPQPQRVTEEAKVPAKEERPESAFEPRKIASEYQHEQPANLMPAPEPVKEPKVTTPPPPEVSAPRQAQNVPRIPIPEISDPEPAMAYNMPNLMHASSNSGQPAGHPGFPKVAVPKPATPAEMQVPQQHPMGYGPGPMSSGGFNPTGQPQHNAQMQQMGLLSQFAQLQQQQSQLNALLSSCGMLPPQNTNAYMQMLQYMQNPMMAGKMQGFAPTPTFGGVQMPSMGRPMQQMMTQPDMASQFGQYGTSVQPQRMMSSMSMYSQPPVTQMSRSEAMPPAPSFQPTQHPQYSQPDLQQYGMPPQAEMQPVVPKPVEPSHPQIGLTPTKPVPQHPKIAPGKPVPKISPISKRTGGLDDLIKVAVAADKKPVSQKLGQPQKSNVVSIPFPGQHPGQDGNEEAKQGESNTLVKLSMSPQRPEEDPYGKRKRPEQDMNREITAEREREMNLQNKKQKPDGNN